jgi:hypothetical protein
LPLPVSPPCPLSLLLYLLLSFCLHPLTSERSQRKLSEFPSPKLFCGVRCLNLNCFGVGGTRERSLPCFFSLPTGTGG